MNNVAEIAKKLGKAQKRGVLNLSDKWGASGEHQAMKRLWYRDDIPMLLDHKSRTDDCWQLRPIGLAVRAHLQAEAMTDITPTLIEAVARMGDITCPLCGETGFDIPGYLYSHRNGRYCAVEAACHKVMAQNNSEVAAALTERKS
jgi:hypothetical protein